jgi:hypothetical protein
MFSFRGDPEWLYNIAGRPVFDPLTSIAFYGGVALAFWHWRDPRRAFVLLWLAIGIVPSLLSWPPGSLGHTIAAQPAAFLFPALALVAAWRWAAGAKPRWVLWSTRLLVIAVVWVFALDSGYDYYVRWPAFPEVRHEYQAPVTAAARYVREHPTSTPVCVSAPYIDHWNPWSVMNFDLYVRDDGARVCWFNGSASTFYSGASVLFPGEGEALFILPDHILLPSALEPELDELLMAGAEPVQIGYRSENGSTLDLYRWRDPGPLRERLASVSSAKLWASPEGPYVAGNSEKERQALSSPLDFGRRLSLLGYTYEGAEVGTSESWRMTTYWRVLRTSAPGANQPLAIFVHLLDDASAVVAGWDGLYLPTASLREGDVFAHVHVLSVPHDLPLGVQRVELGVYSPISQERLQLFVGDGEETAPHNRVLLSPLRVR